MRNRSVIQPLRAHVIDLTTSPKLDFMLTPATTVQAQSSNLSERSESIPTSSNNGALNWRCPTLRKFTAGVEQAADGRPPRVGCKLMFTVRFL